jgi:hypothetical protein
MDTKKYVVDDQYLDEQVKFDDYDQAIEYCYEQEIIYYSKAMNYLIENDASLKDSLAIATEYGIDDPSKLNSEYLATIHYQDALINSIGEAD